MVSALVRFIQFKVTLKLRVGNQAGATEYGTDVVACDARMKTEGAKWRLCNRSLSLPSARPLEALRRTRLLECRAERLSIAHSAVIR